MNDTATFTASDLGTLIIFAVLLGLIPAVIAQRKGLSFGSWWVFGMLFFILALPLALMAKPAPDPTLRKCPHCAEMIKQEATVCRHCGRDAGLPAAGWYPDPQGSELTRYWDGHAWTEKVQ